jgi:hypothetical protein
MQRLTRAAGTVVTCWPTAAERAKERAAEREKERRTERGKERRTEREKKRETAKASLGTTKVPRELIREASAWVWVASTKRSKVSSIERAHLRSMIWNDSIHFDHMAREASADAVVAAVGLTPCFIDESTASLSLKQKCTSILKSYLLSQRCTSRNQIH